MFKRRKNLEVKCQKTKLVEGVFPLTKGKLTVFVIIDTTALTDVLPSLPHCEYTDTCTS